MCLCETPAKCGWERAGRPQHQSKDSWRCCSLEVSIRAAQASQHITQLPVMSRSPVELRVGSTGAGLFVGCGVGLGIVTPVSLHSVPVLGQLVRSQPAMEPAADCRRRRRHRCCAATLHHSAPRPSTLHHSITPTTPPPLAQAASLATSLGSLNHATGLGGLTSAARRRVQSLGVRGLDLGFGCGVILGYGWGAGLMLKPTALQSLAGALQSAGQQVAARLPPPMQAALQRHQQQPGGAAAPASGLPGLEQQQSILQGAAQPGKLAQDAAAVLPAAAAMLNPTVLFASCPPRCSCHPHACRCHSQPQQQQRHRHLPSGAAPAAGDGAGAGGAEPPGAEAAEPAGRPAGAAGGPAGRGVQAGRLRPRV